MQTFTIGLGRIWWLRVWRRNALARTSDRVEALVLALGVLIVVVATPIAGAIGTSIHDVRTVRYAEEAKTRHEVTATAIDDGSADMASKSVTFVARAEWNARGRDHVGVVGWDGEAKAGDRQNIWVDLQGENVDPPTPLSRAAHDAVMIAMFVWLGVVEAVAALVYVIHRWLDRLRYAAWDRQIVACADDDGRADRQS
jgi:hypothetical protein